MKKLFIFIVLFYISILGQQNQDEAYKSDPDKYFDFILKQYKEQNFSQVVNYIDDYNSRFPQNNIHNLSLLLIKANSLYELGALNKAEYIINNILSAYNDSSSVGTSLFILAKIYKARFDYRNTILTLDKSLLYAKNDEYLREKILNFIEDTFFEDLKFEDYSFLLGQCKNDIFIKNLLYFNALKFYDMNKMQEAKVLFTKLRDEYPDFKSYVIKRYLKEIDSFLAINNKIAIIAPLSGKYQFYGEAFLNSAKLLLDNFNRESNYKVKLVAFDNRGDPIKTAEIFKRDFLNDSILALIGPIRASSSIAAGILAGIYNIPLIAPTVVIDSFTNLGNTVYQMSVPTTIQGRAIAEYCVSHEEMHNFLIIAPLSSYGEKIVRSFADLAEKLGARVIDTLYYDEGQQDYRNLLDDFINKILSDSSYIDLIDTVTVEDSVRQFYKLDGIFIPASKINDVLYLVPQIISKLISGRFIGNSIWMNDKLFSIDYHFIKGAIIASDIDMSELNNVEKNNFISQYKAKYGKSPSNIALKSYDAINLILSGCKQGYSRRADLLNYLDTLSNYQGIAGRYNFTKYKRTNSSIYFFHLKGKSFIRVN